MYVLGGFRGDLGNYLSLSIAWNTIPFCIPLPVETIVHKFDTSALYMLNGLLTNCDIWLVSSYLG